MSETEQIIDGYQIDENEANRVVTPVEGEVEQVATESPEDQAKRMGWKPEEDYKGPEGKWVDAESFLDNTENDPAQLRRSLRTIERNYQKMEKGMDALISHQDRQVEQAKEDAYAKAAADHEAKFMQAIEDGDEEAAAQLYQEKQAPKEQGQDSAVNVWANKPENAWFKTDKKMNEDANRRALALTNEGVETPEMLKQVDEFIRETYPAAFPKARKAPKTVNGGNRNGVVVKHTVEPFSYEALNQESRGHCDGFVRMMKGKGFNEEKARAEFLECSREEMFK